MNLATTPRMIWLWLSAAIVLLGAEFNAETEHQTARDSTEGDPKPLGSRGAMMADHVASTSEAEVHGRTASRAFTLLAARPVLQPSSSRSP